MNPLDVIAHQIDAIFSSQEALPTPVAVWNNQLHGLNEIQRTRIFVGYVRKSVNA